MYQQDPYLDDLLRRPMQMANQEDLVDDFDDEDDDDMFGADLLAAAQEEREEEEREAAEFAASLLGDDAVEEAAPQEEAVAEAPPEPVKLFTRPGIRRNLIGYAALTLFGLVPLVMLVMFGANAGLSPLMTLFSFAMLVGLGVSAYNLLYSFQHGYEFTVSFNVRSFFKLWPELAVVSAVLILVSFWNLSQMDAGKSLTLSGKQLPSADAQAVTETTTSTVEHEEKVIYSSFKKAPAKQAYRTASTPRKYRSGYYKKPAYKSAYAKPVSKSTALVGKASTQGKTAASTASHAAPAAHSAGRNVPAAHKAAPHAAAATAVAATTAVAAEHATHAAPAAGHDSSHSAAGTEHNDAATPVASEGTVALPSGLTAPENAAGASVAVIGSQMDLADRANQLFDKPVAGAAVGLIGTMSDKLDGVALPPQIKKVKVLSSDNPVVNNFFMGGALCAAFGYAFVLGLAGAIFGGLRKFETPFSQKYVEIINIESGEVTSDVRPIAPVMKYLNVVSRVFIGLFYGGTLGFILGLAIVVPMVVLFKGSLANPGAPSAALLQTLGLSSLPDQAFTNAVTLGGFLIPLILLIVTKMSPQGLSVSEELMRQHYEIKPTGRFVSPEQLAAGIANPAAVNFGSMMIPDDVLETELSTHRLLNEMSLDDDNLTSEIIEEFGREFETVFGIDTRELISQPRAKQTVDRKRLASALDESFGELGNVPVEISAELGQASLPITEWLNLREGTLVLLDKRANEEIDILFNGARKGKGKLIVSENALAVKVSTTQFQESNGNGKLV